MGQIVAVNPCYVMQTCLQILERLAIGSDSPLKMVSVSVVEIEIRLPIP